MSGNKAPMRLDDFERVAHEVRLLAQERTCCPHHAGETLMLVLAGFALDDTDDDPHQAAAKILREAKRFAHAVRTGQFRMNRSRPS